MRLAISSLAGRTKATHGRQSVATSGVRWPVGGGGGRLGLLSLIELLHGPETLLQYSLSPGLRHSAAAAAGPRCSGKWRGWCRGGASARPPMIHRFFFFVQYKY